MPTESEISDRIDLWHHQQCALGIHEAAGTIQDALGWTREEYARWVSDARDVPERPLPQILPTP